MINLLFFYVIFTLPDNMDMNMDILLNTLEKSVIAQNQSSSCTRETCSIRNHKGCNILCELSPYVKKILVPTSESEWCSHIENLFPILKAIFNNKQQTEEQFVISVKYFLTLIEHYTSCMLVGKGGGVNVNIKKALYIIFLEFFFTESSLKVLRSPRFEKFRQVSLDKYNEVVQDFDVEFREEVRKYRRKFDLL